MEKITNIRGQLLEGCIWDERNRYLYFLDIEKFRIYRMREGQEPEVFQLHTYVSAIVLNEDGSLTAALQDGLYQVDFEKRALNRIMESGFPDYIRYNDGKCDPYGNFWIGSMYADQKRPGAAGGGSLFCIRDGQVKAEYSSYTIPNGLDWYGEFFYHTETSQKKISVYRQNPKEQCKLGEQVWGIDLSGEEGSPDGMCVDREGNLWIAMWGGYQVIGYDPKGRAVFKRIPVPDANVSCCILGGAEGNRLFVTTARDDAGNGGEVYTTVLTDYYGKAGYYYGSR